MSTKVKPLRKRTMTLDQLRDRTVKVLVACRNQFRRPSWEAGKTDDAFIEGPLETLLEDIMQDISIETMQPSNHVAYLRYTARSIVTCDSDAPGAFKVYKRE